MRKVTATQEPGKWGTIYQTSYLDCDSTLRDKPQIDTQIVVTGNSEDHHITITVWHGSEEWTSIIRADESPKPTNWKKGEKW